MKRRIFIKEFLGKKSTTVFLILAFLSINIILAFITNSLLNQFDGAKRPDVVVYGKANQEMVYMNIANEIDYFLENDTNNYFHIFPCKAVQCLEVTQSPMKKANIEINAFKSDYLKKHVQSMLSEGRLPEKDNEVLAGNYFLNYFSLKNGDNIGTEVLFDNRGEPTMLLNLDIGNPEVEFMDFKEFKVVGVVKNPTYQFTVIRTFEKDYQPNKMLIYFNNGKASLEKFKELRDDLEIDIPSNNFGSYSIQYNEGENLSLIVSFSVQLLVFLIISMLIILYITKGMKKKIGILKSLGIKDKSVINLIAKNFLIFIVVIDFIALGITNVLFTLLNKSIDDFYGFQVNTFAITRDVLLVNIVFNVLLSIIIFVSVKVRTTKSTPKESMLRR